LNPYISVIVPTCDDDLRLEWLLEGLCCQTVKDFEVIVVNDAGPICTEALVSSFKKRLNTNYYYFGKPKKEQRAGATRNYGAYYSVGDLLVFLDTDIVPDPDLIEAHAAHYMPAACYFGYRRHYPMELVRPFSAPLDYDQLYRFSRPDQRLGQYGRWKKPEFYLHFFGCNYSIPARIFCELGGHDERCEGWGGEDIDLSYRIIQSGYVIYPLWGMGMGTHLDHPKRPHPTVEQVWICNPDEPLVRNGGLFIRKIEEARMI
jgi:glycosyltransferase involved in cell wall biosynthesis